MAASQGVHSIYEMESVVRGHHYLQFILDTSDWRGTFLSEHLFQKVYPEIDSLIAYVFCTMLCNLTLDWASSSYPSHLPLVICLYNFVPAHKYPRIATI